MVRHIALHSSQPFSKYSLDNLLRMQELSDEERLGHLEEVLHIGISKIILLLQDLPLGFGSVEPIRKVIRDYVQDIHDLVESPSKSPAEFHSCIRGIFARHQGMNSQIGCGLRDFQKQIGDLFGRFGELPSTNCAEVAGTVAAVRRIELALDEFFTVRSTLRLLITHCIQLSPGDDAHVDGQRFQAMHELLARAPDSLRAASLQMDTGHTGAVCLDTRPALIMVKAFRHARKMYTRKFGVASELLVNGIPSREYVASGIHMDVPVQFPYVEAHLYYIFFEVLKNALRASIEKMGADGVPPPIHASIMTGSSLTDENEKVFKISDSGVGIQTKDVRKVWSYFYSTHSQGMAAAADSSQDALPLGAKGLGLPLSRVLARYFGGEIDVHSIPRMGTDVYIYL